ncbi:nucleotide sugar dehydrogenase [bacterium]|nr:nucleotide sugar dehydrogenase [bacterium]
MLEKKIEDKSARIAVTGLGYVGLPLAVAFARAGYRVFGLDVQKKKADAVNRGESYIGDISSEDVAAFVKSGQLTASSDFSLLEQADCVSICVPTPIDKNKVPDTSYISNVSDIVRKYMKKQQLVVLESTTYPGTTEEVVLPILARDGKKVGHDFFLAFSPERIDPGNRLYGFSKVPRVVGGVTGRCTAIAASLYEHVVPSVFRVDSPKVAEMSKLLENIFRIVNISMINEMALLCDRMGIDIWQVVDAASSKPYGFMPFYPGPGLGGHCIPVDPFYLSWKAKEYDFYTRFIDLAGEINDMMPHFVVTKVGYALNTVGKSLKNSKILVIGVAYKRDIDDIRESPALSVIQILQKKMAKVTLCDPYVPSVTIGNRAYTSHRAVTEKLVASADAVLILTDHSAVDYNLIGRHADIIVDTRNAMHGIRKRKVYKL